MSMKYLRLFEKQLDLFDGEYREDVLKVIHRKIDDFINKESIGAERVIEESYEKWLSTNYGYSTKSDTRQQKYFYFTRFITSNDFDELYVELFKKFYENIEEILSKSSIRLSKHPTDAFNIKYKDLYKMYMEHKPQEVIEYCVIKYYEELFDKEPSLYKQIEKDLPDWIKDAFPDLKRGNKANFWDFKN